MNRQEAVDFIHQTSRYLRRHEGDNSAEALEIALETILPTPAPDTGLVPCGCGGKARCSVTCYVCSRGADGGCGHWANCSRANVKHEGNPHDQDLYKPKAYCDKCGRKLKEGANE